jgi:uncharacterized protein (DUF58 family)
MAFWSRTLDRLSQFLDVLLFGHRIEELRRFHLEFERELAEKTRAIEISSRKLVNDVLAGEYHSVFKGRGMEFAEVREYTPGDDVRTIEWNVTARMGAPFVKTYTEERELTVILMVDASASGDFGSTRDTKRVVMARVCAMLAFSAITNNDRVGLIVFTDNVEVYIPPKKGKKHVLRLIREILSFHPGHARTNIATALEHLNRVQKRKAVVFLISDFLDKDYGDPLRIAAKRHDMIAVTVADPLELEMRAVGMMVAEDAETGQIAQLDTNDRRGLSLFQQQARRDAGQLDTFFKQNKIDSISLVCGEDLDLPLVRFFKTRMNRLGM